jgi:hypothetical protein
MSASDRTVSDDNRSTAASIRSRSATSSAPQFLQQIDRRHVRT